MLLALVQLDENTSFEPQVHPPARHLQRDCDCVHVMQSRGLQFLS